MEGGISEESRNIFFSKEMFNGESGIENKNRHESPQSLISCMILQDE